MGCCRIASGFLTHGTIKTVHGNIGQAFNADMFAQFFKVEVRCNQLVAVGRINSLVTGMQGRRAGDPHMNFGGTRGPDHFNDLG